MSLLHVMLSVWASLAGIWSSMMKLISLEMYRKMGLNAQGLEGSPVKTFQVTAYSNTASELLMELMALCL